MVETAAKKPHMQTDEMPKNVKWGKGKATPNENNYNQINCLE